MRATASTMLLVLFGACVLQVEGPSGGEGAAGGADASAESTSSPSDASVADARPAESAEDGADAAPSILECAGGDGVCPDGCDPTNDGDCGPSCDELFGTAPGYILCSEDALTCSFAATTNGGNCNEMCASLGSTCVDAIDNAEPDLCADNGKPDDCTTLRQTEICVCSRLLN